MILAGASKIFLPDLQMNNTVLDQTITAYFHEQSVPLSDLVIEEPPLHESEADEDMLNNPNHPPGQLPMLKEISI